MSMNAALHAREIVGHITAVVAIEMLAAMLALRHRLVSLRRDGTYHRLTVDSAGKGAQAVWSALEEAFPEIFQLPLNRDVVLYPYVERMIEVVQSGALVDAIQAAGITLRDVRSNTELVTSSPN
jgi:histidine ammonia-lyase